MSDGNRLEGMVLSALALGSAVVGLDGTTTALLTSTAQELMARRRNNLVGTVRLVQDACAGMPADEFQASWSRPVFGELFETILPAAMKAGSEERRRQLANVLEAGLKSDDRATERLLVLARLLEEVDELGIVLLESFEVFGEPSSGSQDLFYEKHRAAMSVFQPLTLDHSQEQWVRHHLSAASLERLISLRLLEPERAHVPAAVALHPNLHTKVEGIIAHLDRDVESQEHQISPLGRLLLRVVQFGFAGLTTAGKAAD